MSAPTKPTDTERLQFLLDEGFLIAVRRCADGRWRFDDEITDEQFWGASWREAIDAAMGAADDNEADG